MRPRGSYGAYTGFVRFYGQLAKDTAGNFTFIEVRAMEESDREINPIDPRWLNGICENYGYVDFSLAH